MEDALFLSEGKKGGKKKEKPNLAQKAAAEREAEKGREWNLTTQWKRGKAHRKEGIYHARRILSDKKKRLIIKIRRFTSSKRRAWRCRVEGKKLSQGKFPRGRSLFL